MIIIVLSLRRLVLIFVYVSETDVALRYMLKTNTLEYHHHPCIDPCTHAWPGLPITPDPILTPAEEYGLALHYTAAKVFAKVTNFNFTELCLYI